MTNMLAIRRVLILGVFMAVEVGLAGPQQDAGRLPVKSQRTVVNQYCATCHNDNTKAGGMSLAAVDLAHIEQHAELAEKMIRKLRAGMMPPPGARRPDADTLQNLAA